MRHIWRVIFCGLTVLLMNTKMNANKSLSNHNSLKANIKVSPKPKRKPSIQVAILLDTSNSMDGLIEQAKNQLWKIVNHLAKVKDKHGADPQIEIALYQYGNDDLSIDKGYVQKVCDFTSELDEVSEKLFALRTNGGAEYCGRVIQSSVGGLSWSDDPNDLQLIFVAGNEAFTQGGIHYSMACNLAKSRNIQVNTIYCGDYGKGVDLSWKEAALLTGGDYMNIDKDGEIVHIETPFDAEISKLNNDLNDTYIPYGRKGFQKKSNQILQDSNASKLGQGSSVERVISKGSKAYYNTSWDLVDASDQEDFELEKVDVDFLPESMQKMTHEEQEKYIEEKRKKRIEIQRQLKELAIKRANYEQKIKEDKSENGKEQLEDVIIETIHNQAIIKGYSFDE